MNSEIELPLQANKLRIYGVAANWEIIKKSAELLQNTKQFLEWEEFERTQRKMNLFLRKSGVKNLNSMAHFDWSWPVSINKPQILELLSLNFVTEKTNLVIVGPNGLGKTMLAQNFVDLAAKKGYSTLFTESSKMLAEIVLQSKRVGLEKALSRYVKPKLLAIDELGYLGYDTVHADLLFQLIQRRAATSSTIFTTNLPFADWPKMFSNAASVTALVDRIIENCEVVQIAGDSYRAKKFQEKKDATGASRANTKKSK